MIGDINAIAPQNPAAQSSGSASTVISSDFQTFLNMLAVQMQNQDPLNPMDSTEFATQLATFSALEQQVLTNDLLQVLDARFLTMNISQLSGWVGMEVQAVMPAQFSGAPIDVVVGRYATADEAYLVIRDEAGEAVRRIAVDEGVHDLVWDGADDDGNPVAHGLYGFEIENLLDGDMLDITVAPIYAQVTEARIGQFGPVLVLGGGILIGTEDVLGLRASR